MIDDQVIDALTKADGRLMRRKDIARKIAEDGGDAGTVLDEALERLCADGRIIRVRGKKYAIPNPDTMVIGHVQMKRRRGGGHRRGNFAFILPTSDEEDDVFVAGNDLFGALDASAATTARSAAAACC